MTEKEDTADKHKLYNMVLSKHPMKVYSQSSDPPTIIALLDLPSPLILVSTHLIAYEENYCERAFQLKLIMHQLNDLMI